ncbi:MAG: NAD(P)-dependent oxidoreductase [Actinomycetota bacterium]|nr:NAD(P)-dependent oxidoreductase [Actinomycetota bacterium]
MKRALVTGASGFIGRHLVNRLIERGYEVHLVGRHPLHESLGGASWRSADLLDPAATRELVQRVRPTHLLHLAWCAEPGRFWTDPENIRWVEATLHLVRRFREAGGERAVVAGSCAEYDLSYGFCSEQHTPLRPNTLYGAAKHATQAVLSGAAPVLGLSVAWGRVFFLYGPGEHPSRLVSSVTACLLRGEPAQCSHGRQLRDFLHVDDVASAFVHLLDSQVQGPVNIGSGTPVSVGAVAARLAEVIGRPELLQHGAVPTPADDPPLIVADARRLQHEVGWRAQWTLESGLEAAVDWWRAELRNRPMAGRRANL